MKLCNGYKVKGAELIKESYSIEGDTIFVNLDASHYLDVMHDLCMQLPEPVFFILELPCDELKEQELRKTNQDPFHKDVCYIDGLPRDTINVFFEAFGDVLVNDGLSTFGFSSHELQVEVMKDKYNCLRIYAENKDQFVKVLKDAKIPLVEHIVLTSDILAQENPGICERYEDEHGRTVFDIRDFLEEKCDLYVDHVDEN